MLHEGLWWLYTLWIKLNPVRVNPGEYSSAQVSLQDIANANELIGFASLVRCVNWRARTDFPCRRVRQGLRKSSQRDSPRETRVSQGTRGGIGRMGDDGTPFDSKI